MEVFESLLKKSLTDYAAGKFSSSYDSLRAAVKYLRALLDAKKQIEQPKLPGT